MKYVLPFMTSFLIVCVLVPYIRTISLRFGFVDRPSTRKIHQSPVPLMGGVAIYIGVITSLFLFDGFSARVLTILIGGSILLITGLLDDGCKAKGKEFPIWPRLVIYMMVSAIPVCFGIQVIGISNTTGDGMLMFPVWLSWLVTMAWVFGITNMVNFIDGVDGLASGIVTIASVTLFVVALLKGQEGTAVLAAILAGACVAFLLYNFYPAKIFMGDAGAIFIGYTLAVVAVDGSFKSATLISILIPIFALGVPILDTIIVFSRRFLERKGFHKADKLHTHHSLMQWGLTQTQTVSFLYLIGAFFSLLSIIILLLTG